MMSLKGAAVSEKIQKEILDELSAWKQKNIKPPHLSVVLVGTDPASEIYVSHKEKMCKKLGFSSEVIKLPENINQKDLERKITELNQNSAVDGVLVQLPLPKQINTRDVLEKINPEKDVDCLTERNLGKVLTGRAVVQPCTPSGIIEILKHYQIDLRGKNIAIIGRSLIVGVPLVHLFLKENASVSVFHSQSENISAQIKNFDIICVAIGKPNLFKYSDFKKDAIVVDVGINRDASGISGDVKNDLGVDSNHLKAATPVPGGVGVMTIAMLMKNTLALARSNRKPL